MSCESGSGTEVKKIYIKILEKNILFYAILIIVYIIIIVLLILSFIIIKKIKKPTINIRSITTNKNECLKKDSICENGTKVSINVNKNTNYNFFVINDDGKKITLIMDKNIGKNISWSSKNTSCSLGPDSLISYIKELTEDWHNIKEKDYTIMDSNNCYDTIVETMHARIPMLEEVSKLGCQYFYENTCPEFLVSNLNSSSGYWLSTSNKMVDSDVAYVVNKNRNLFTPWVISGENYGLRLIIEVEK